MNITIIITYNIKHKINTTICQKNKFYWGPTKFPGTNSIDHVIPNYNENLPKSLCQPVKLSHLPPDNTRSN